MKVFSLVFCVTSSSAPPEATREERFPTDSDILMSHDKPKSIDGKKDEKT